MRLFITQEVSDDILGSYDKPATEIMESIKKDMGMRLGLSLKNFVDSKTYHNPEDVLPPVRRLVLSVDILTGEQRKEMDDMLRSSLGINEYKRYHDMMLRFYEANADKSGVRIDEPA